MNMPDFATRVMFVIGCAFMGAGLAGYGITACSTSTPPAKVEKAAAEFCTARAVYVLANVATGSKLDPEPASPRAALEAAEDRFCLARQGDAGP